MTENGILISHLRYLSIKHNKSQSWKERSVFAVILLIKYINKNKKNFKKATELLRSFTLSLTEGTINPVNFEDPSGLFWKPRRIEDSRTLLSHITSYTDYLSIQDCYNSARINPFYKANSFEERLNWCAYYQKKANIFLPHLEDSFNTRKKLAYVRGIKTPDSPIISLPNVVRFPENEFDNLMEKGFVRAHSNVSMEPWQRYDYKNQAIALLMHYGGLRISEVFHIYLCDILLDQKRLEAIVRVYHPSNGDSPDIKYHTRKEYLAKCYRLRPRNEYPKTKRLFSGWKSPLLTDRRGFFQVNFIPPRKAVEFLYIWKNYLEYQRVEPPHGFNHPYAFTNNEGHPETIKNYQRMHSDAVRRIGLVPKKYFGTTEHGHRHSYGYRLASNGFSQVEIQKAMHHKSPESCLVYIKPSDEDVRRKFNQVV